MSTILNTSCASSSSQADNKPENQKSCQDSTDFGSFQFDSSNLYLTKPYSTHESQPTDISREKSLPGVFSLTKPPEGMNYSGPRTESVTGTQFSQGRPEYSQEYSQSSSSSKSTYEEARTGYGNIQQTSAHTSHPSHLRVGLPQESNLPFRRHSVAGLPGASYSLPLPHGAGREPKPPSSLSKTVVGQYEETKKYSHDPYYSTDSLSSKRKEDPVHVNPSAFKRRASLCGSLPTSDPTPPLPPQMPGFLGPTRNTHETLGSGTSSLKLPKIQEIEGYSSEYSEKSSSSGYEHSLPQRLLRQENLMGRRASLPVISLPHEHSIHERNLSRLGDSDHSTYVFPGPSDGDRISPYSRTPALKVSHKLAERKRRKEMKELFDELRERLPVEKSVKMSKWEILSKSFEYIQQLHTNQDKLNQEVIDLRQQVAILKQGRRRSD